MPANPDDDEEDDADKNEDEPEIDILLDEAANVLTDWIIGATEGKRLVENFEMESPAEFTNERRSAQAE